LLRLRRGLVVGEDPLVVDVGGERRPAWADSSLVGEVREGDEVVVNTEALDLELGSGGFDVVHVNLSRGLDAGGGGDSHVMKLNYTSLQHAVAPVEPPEEVASGMPAMPVLVIPLHSHLGPAAWAARSVAPDLRLGFVQTAGGALPGRLSRDVLELRSRGLLGGHVTVAPTYGGEHEAISVPGAIDAASRALDWGAVIVGPGPGILGSASRYGHGGMAALDNAHAALALALPTVLSPRLSAADPRPRHRGVSHHTRTVLELLLGRVEVAVPEGADAVSAQLAPLLGARHTVATEPAELDRYVETGLPARAMGRGPDEDPLFFAAPLAAGRRLGRLAGGTAGE
jgi:hypothetical protein